ncbi:carboxynorspermidine decarboxylase [Mobilisporobacter senegalensis]|uniref:Carboxynorspermidine decarboxylase n=1 Tax=Mobilisporobacter senegalensis TaxID=1329262 RepID=A0A3N1X6B8_9FIRM|nr:carboxynorspermidine decarboxylase [Mobilisporobacter senegalensis]ROR22330.1 carboxynorspermidine decarboxylase [Mobilisporobacter senegalensis]
MNFNEVQTPCYVVDERLLIQNLELLKSIEDRTGCHILLAQKAFSMYSLYPLIGKYLHGVASSSLHEARLGYEEMGKEVHTFSPAYIDSDFDDIMKYSDHIVFNSFDEWGKYKDRIKKTNKHIECGIRINPEYSEIETDIYNPCFTHSRLGVTLANFKPDELDGIDGLHFHTMCEQNSDTLERTIKVVDEKFGPYMKQMKWINFGGGHHITREDYDVETLIRCINYIQDKYDVEVYLEPGEAVALNTGFLVSTVLAITENEMKLGILDTSAACHMPDVIEMPYRPNIIDAGEPGDYPYTYRFGGPTCLAGDIIGDYSFQRPLTVGDKVVFCDMAIYSMVKNNTFNGVNLPSIAYYSKKEGMKVIKTFGYEDFKSRL